LFGDNKGSLQNVTDPSIPLNKQNVGISYHTARECEATKITKRYFVNSEHNTSDGQTKPLKPVPHYTLYKAGGPIFCKEFEP
jgi:hypothetical protein